MAKTIEAPNGYKYYVTPETIKDANEWLKRTGVTHIKFGKKDGKAFLKGTYTDRVYMEADKIVDICYFITHDISQMIVCGIPFYDWYRPMDYVPGDITYKLYSGDNEIIRAEFNAKPDENGVRSKSIKRDKES